MAGSAGATTGDDGWAASIGLTELTAQPVLRRPAATQHRPSRKGSVENRLVGFCIDWAPGSFQVPRSPRGLFGSAEKGTCGLTAFCAHSPKRDGTGMKQKLGLSICNHLFTGELTERRTLRFSRRRPRPLARSVSFGCPDAVAGYASRPSLFPVPPVMPGPPRVRFQGLDDVRSPRRARLRAHSCREAAPQSVGRLEKPRLAHPW